MSDEKIRDDDQLEEPVERVEESEIPSQDEDILSDDERALLEDENEAHFSLHTLEEKSQESWLSSDKFKRYGLIAAVVVVVMFIFGAMFALLNGSASKNEQVQSYRDEVTIDWLHLVDTSDQIEVQVDDLESRDDFATLALVLERERDYLRESIARLSALATPEQYAAWHSELVNFLVSVSDYLDELDRVMTEDNLDAIRDQALSELVATGSELKTRAALLRDQADFIKSDINSALFVSLPSNVRSILGDELEAKIQEQIDEEVSKQKEEEAKQQAEADEQAARQTMEAFMQAYVDQDTASAEGYLALNVRDDYALEQDPNDRITAFSVLSFAKQEDGLYTGIVRITHSKPDPDYNPPASAPVNEDIPRVTETTNEEIRLTKLNEQYFVSFVEFLEN